MTEGITTSMRWFLVTSSNNTTLARVQVPVSEVPVEVEWNVAWSLMPIAQRRREFGDRIENYFDYRRKRGRKG
jgi:hypothetical protein